jgi:F-type H+-transporting ATPase subunit delta
MAATFTRPYVEAARDAAGSLEAFAALVPELERLASALSGSEELRTLLRNPAVPREKKRAVLDAVAARVSVGAMGLRLAQVLLANRRLPRISEMAAAFRDQVNREQRIVEAALTTARPLSDGARADLSRALEARTGQSVRLKSNVNPALLGGFVVQIGSEVYDASLAHRLEKAKNSLHAATGNVPK